ncbi:DUF3800 domain-containing protein [Herbiconiux sp. VKM Ac-1786]|uniref:DUF3800 domain-containing protein n=1 Tax=Herbiconiux sp. VKM Ac-1786 TaxID=2783824 RepID=UPI00188C3A9C|nr:DUF3800 domain-containing protein [Herbiconiux sp. VKM Ac-1786]MBF4571603.1 DUF3800 domain-containing protein [Herbiconiux sp. VKM Ac-1786]
MTVSRLLYVDDSGSVTSGLIVYGWVECDPTHWKTLGRAVALDCLAALSRHEHVRVGAVFRRTGAKGADFHRERGAVYRRLVERWDADHRRSGSFALVSMDGNGTDGSYAEAHRSLALATRHIIEDPTFYDSRRSQFVQLADLVAYAAFSSLNRHEGNRFAWDWYADHLKPVDPSGGPQQI